VAVAAEFTLAGRAPLPAREDLEQGLAAEDALVARLEPLLDGMPDIAAGPARETWRDERISDALALLADDAEEVEELDEFEDLEFAPEAMARVVAGLDDVRVRDTVLWELSRWDTAVLLVALDRLSLLLRAAPAGHVAPVACCAAITAWLLGDGARASVATARARADDPHYSLGELLAVSLGAGLPPQAWRESMAGLTRDLCRYGSDAGHSAAS
jgi:hypothetical protein